MSRGSRLRDKERRDRILENKNTITLEMENVQIRTQYKGVSKSKTCTKRAKVKKKVYNIICMNKRDICNLTIDFTWKLERCIDDVLAKNLKKHT